MKKLLMLLKNCRIVATQNEKREILENKDILIENGEIIEIGENLSKKDEVIDASNKVVIPGLINCHTHAAMNLLRGVSDDKDLQSWLAEDIWPKEAKLTGEMCYYGTLLACSEMLLSGTTCFNDMYFHIEDVAKATEKSGMRGFLGYAMIDLFDEEKREKELKVSEKTIKSLLEMKCNRIIPTVDPHSVETCSNELLLKSKEQAEKYNLLLHIHLAETLKEREACTKQRGKNPVKILDELGYLERKLIAAHGVYLDMEEIALLNKKKIFVSYNPCSNAKLASGICPARELEFFCIGTDSVASNNNLNLFEEMKFGALLQRIKYNTARAIPTQRLFDAATIQGARALGIENQVGSIEVGKKADLTIIDKDTIVMVPNYNTISNVVFSFNGAVSDVLIDGKLVVKDKKIQNYNLQSLIEKSNSFFQEITS